MLIASTSGSTGAKMQPVNYMPRTAPDRPFSKADARVGGSARYPKRSCKRPYSGWFQLAVEGGMCTLYLLPTVMIGITLGLVVNVDANVVDMKRANRCASSTLS